MGNNVFTIVSFFYSLILNVFFFAKKRLKNIETDLFSLIIITNFINILFALLSYYVELVNGNPIINNILAKGVIFCFYTFSYLFNLYVITISKSIKDNFKKNDKKKIFIIYILFGLPILFLKIQYYHQDNVIYSFGSCANYQYIIISLMITYWIILLIKNFKSINRKKSIPIIAFITLLIAVAMIQRVRPELLLLTWLETFVIFLMYFTIENPDMKLLEEVHKSKEISDNANEEKTLFLYNMTQEIRSITNNINESANIILDSKDYNEIYDSARDIIGATSKFTSMTNDILDVNTIDETTIKVYNSKYNIKNLLKQIVNIYTDICKNKELNFRTNIDHDIPEIVYGDSISLKEVLTIILNNSAKYTDKGYVELSVNTIIKNDICRLIFTIEDSGLGIKSEDVAKIKFDNKSLGKANKLITLMNGTLLISSDYGVGTKVKIILDQKIEKENNTEIAKYESNFDNISILSVDDSESGLKIIEKLLKGTNIKLDLATTGKECIDKIKIGKYDLILLDEELSQISGIDLMKKIKALRNFKTPVLLLTKDNSYEYNEEYLKIGFSDYILKPLKKETLLNKINEYTKKDKK